MTSPTERPVRSTPSMRSASFLVSWTFMNCDGQAHYLCRHKATCNERGAIRLPPFMDPYVSFGCLRATPRDGRFSLRSRWPHFDWLLLKRHTDTVEVFLGHAGLHSGRLISRIRWALDNPKKPMAQRKRPSRAMPRIPKGRRAAVARAEFNRVIDILNERGEILKDYRVALDDYQTTLDRIRRDLDIQFERIAQLQREVDSLKRDRP